MVRSASTGAPDRPGLAAGDAARGPRRPAVRRRHRPSSRLGQPGRRQLPSARRTVGASRPATRPTLSAGSPAAHGQRLEHPQGHRVEPVVRPPLPAPRVAASTPQVADQVEHVGGVGDQGGPAGPDQLVAAGRRRRGDRARAPPSRAGTAPSACPAVLQRAAADRRLDHDRAPAQRGDDPVAVEEPAPGGPSARRQLGHHGAARPGPRAAGRRAPPGRRTSTPQASTATVGPSTASAPRWAAASMPNAPPDTTVQPRSPSPAASSAATCSPYGVQARAPTTATAAPGHVAEVPSPTTHSGQRRAVAQVVERSRPLVVAGHDDPRTRPGDGEVGVDVQRGQPRR